MLERALSFFLMFGILNGPGFLSSQELSSRQLSSNLFRESFLPQKQPLWLKILLSGSLFSEKQLKTPKKDQAKIIRLMDVQSMSWYIYIQAHKFCMQNILIRDIWRVMPHFISRRTAALWDICCCCYVYLHCNPLFVEPKQINRNLWVVKNAKLDFTRRQMCIHTTYNHTCI